MSFFERDSFTGQLRPRPVFRIIAGSGRPLLGGMRVKAVSPGITFSDKTMTDSSSSHYHNRDGARQKERFDPQRALVLDDRARFEYLPALEVAQLLDTPAGGALADFGTGTGAYAIELARLRPDIQIFAVDELPEMLERLRSKPDLAMLKNLRPMLASEADNLRGQMDRVLALNVLHELGDEALRGLASLLKPAGFSVFIDWNAEAERPVGPPADHVYTPAEARSRLGRMNWTVIQEKLFLYHYAFRAVISS